MTHQKLALTLVGLVLVLFTAPAAHAATITARSELFCRHLETLHQYDRAPDVGKFYNEQFQKGECVFSGGSGADGSLQIGTTVRIEKRSGNEICVTPVGSTAPCLWTSSQAITE